MVAQLDSAGRLCTLAEADEDAEILALVGALAPDLVVVDAPLQVPNEHGRRDVEAVLAWCDIPSFPVSRARLATVFGGARGVALAGALEDPGRDLVEALPDQVLRQIAWEEHEAGGLPIDLADYRAAWLRVRAPRYRPKGAGRADPRGFAEAWRLLGLVVDMGAWTPSAGDDDWEAIGAAAGLDAISCAYAGLRLVSGSAIRVGAPGAGEVAVPADINLRTRLEATLQRLRAEGTIVI